MRQLHTAAREKTEEAPKVISFMHDETEVSFHAPDPTQMAVLMTDMSNRNGNGVITAITMFFDLSADAETERYFRGRLLDSEDDFDISGEGGLMDCIEVLVEESTDRPIKQPSDFTPSQKPTGTSSTAKRRARGSTSSTSPRAGSATSSSSGRSSASKTPSSGGKA